MDENAYHAHRSQINTIPCVFSKAILANCAQCELSNKRSLAEREMVSCNAQVAQINCTTLHNLFRERAAFALKISPANTEMAHNKAMQLQCGGLIGLQTVLEVKSCNVHALVQLTLENEKSMLNLPWQEIVAAIAIWKPRQRFQSKPN
ncbi:MAG TPA: hypothetical protein PKC80_08115 [Burkholderiaceae bacterium]|nr:hypothetical protein [Burkholderiaceae bacterium]